MAQATASLSSIPSTIRRNSGAAAWWSLICFGSCVFLMAAALSVIALPWLHLSWWQAFRRCVSIASALSLWLFVHKIERGSFRSYGLVPIREGKHQYRVGFLFGAFALALIVAFGFSIGAYQIQLYPNPLKFWGTLIGLLPAMCLVSVLEELVFRGFILQHLITCSRVVAVIISSALYAAVHVKVATISPNLCREIVGLFLLGVMLSISYLMTNQLSVSIGLHAVLAYGARVNKLLFTIPLSPHEWLVGTSRMVNGVAAWVVLLVVGGMIAWWVRSSHGGGVHAGKT